MAGGGEQEGCALAISRRQEPWAPVESQIRLRKQRTGGKVFISRKRSLKPGKWRLGQMFRVWSDRSRGSGGGAEGVGISRKAAVILERA